MSNPETTFTLSFEDRINLAHVVSLQTGNVGVIRRCLSILHKLNLTNEERAQFTKTPAGDITYLTQVDPLPAEPAIPAVETPEQKATREADYHKSVEDVKAANTARVTTLAGATTSVSFTPEELAAIREMLDDHHMLAKSTRTWVQLVLNKLVAKLAEPVPGPVATPEPVAEEHEKGWPGGRTRKSA